MKPPLHPNRQAIAALWLCMAGAAMADEAAPVPPPPAAEEATGADPRVALSGFGTLGWAQSNQAWRYRRFVDHRGSAKLDSLMGAQVDAQLNSTWSATVQAKLTPSEGNDQAAEVKTSWAFLAWRPDNNWLLRAGKLRVPFFLRSEHMDVGATYDEVRLPADIYGIVPTTDFRGWHLTHSREAGEGEFNFDAYHGSSRQHKRVWVREGLPGLVDSGAMFREGKVAATGVVATWNGGTSKARLGWHRFRIGMPDGKEMPVRPTWVPLGPGVGYWQTMSALPGPGVATVPEFVNTMLIVGGEFSPAAGWKLLGEYGRIRQFKTERSLTSTGAYLTVSREIGAFSPYVTWSRIFSDALSREWARTLDETTVPSGVPGAAMLNTSMRMSADSVPVYDQHSWALGGAYALSPTHKFKAEWMRTQSKVSSMLDLRAGEKMFKRRSVDVLSLNYSFVF